MLIDSHCHLDFPALAQDRAGVLTRARAAGVLRFLNISTTKTDALSVRMTAESEPDVFATVGAHPHHVEEVGEDFTTDELFVAARHPNGRFSHSAVSALPNSRRPLRARRG